MKSIVKQEEPVSVADHFWKEIDRVLEQYRKRELSDERKRTLVNCLNRDIEEYNKPFETIFLKACKG